MADHTTSLAHAGVSKAKERAGCDARKARTMGHDFGSEQPLTVNSGMDWIKGFAIGIPDLAEMA